MFLFGKDIELNICMFIIFVDGVKFFVFVLLKEFWFLFGLIFSFNNLVLFVENNELIYNILFFMFWKMGCSSFEMFFVYISRL